MGIFFCFVILLAYTRPCIGQFRVKPVDVVVLAEELTADESVALQSDATRR